MSAEKQGRPGYKGSGRISWDEVLFLLLCFLILFARFRNPALLLGSYQDDFFYYLKVAQNLAATGVSTFNGITLTNGYHPLWMAVLVVLCRAFHGIFFFAALQTVSLGCAAGTYFLMRRTLRFYLPDLPARCGAFVLGSEALLLIRYGMEVTLTLPLAMLLIYLLLRRGPPAKFSQAAMLGVIASLLILSRLDAGLLVAILCIALLLPPMRTARSAATVLGFLCGTLPLLCLYFAFNLHFFHLLTPVSGLAKQMKNGMGFSDETWRSLLPNDRMRLIVVLPELLFIGVAAVTLLLQRVQRPAIDLVGRRVLWSLLLFPLLHMITLSLLSDWSVWPWYFYSLTLGATAAYVLLATGWPGRSTVLLMCSYGAVLVLYSCVYAWRGPNSVTVFRSSMQVARYMDAHPGIYMMGDQAGTTAYLSHQPILQTEGLVMDKSFLQLMRAGTSLRQVAAIYHAKYYAKIGDQYQGACIHFAEPSNAGPDSPRMRGTICHPPLAVFYREADNMPIRIYEAAWLQ